MAVPPKYRQMCDFHRYYGGELKAPILTLVIGGNHEASAYMDELRYGGWLAPNIYYLGTAGCVRVGDLRVAGRSDSRDMGVSWENFPHRHKPRCGLDIFPWSSI